jgi:hypothetical protein
VASRVLVVAASVVLLLALVAGYARIALVDSGQFANRATAILRDDAARSSIADRITDEVVLRNEEDLIAARPIISSVTSELLESRAFTKLFRAAVRDVHRTLFGRGQDTVTLTVADVGTVLAAALEKVRPALARELEATGRVELLRRDLGAVSARLARIADRVRILAVLLALAYVALAAAALWTARDRRRACVELGLGAAVAGAVVAVGFSVGRWLVARQLELPEDQATAEAVWDAFLGDLRTAAWIVAGSGAVVAAAADSLIRPVALGVPLRRAGRALLTEPRRPALRALRGVGFVAAGVTLIVARDAVIAAVLTAAGLYLIYEGLTAVLRLVYRPRREDEEEPEPERPREWRRLVAPLGAGVLIAGAVAVFLASGGTTTAAPPLGPCNGHRELCAKRLQDVVLPATHNSMSAPLPGWFSSQQDRGIPDQLRDGIRGLLFDTHYADRLDNGRLRTFFGSEHKLRQQAAQDGVNPDAVEAALRLRERAGFKGEGERGMYLCHTFCELGGTRLEPVLDDIRDFLVANPEEVVVIVNQDYVTPADFVEAARDAGLERHVYRGPVGPEGMTLREMIDQDQRLLLLAENHAGAAPWYRLAYQRITQETRFSFGRTRQLTDPAALPASCAPNRGPEGAPVFLLNHWITTDPLPRPSDAAKVNAFEPLRARATECGRMRGQLVNLVAVDFYLRGDLFRVVDDLNGVG